VEDENRRLFQGNPPGRELLSVDRRKPKPVQVGEVAKARQGTIEPADFGLQNADQLGGRPIGMVIPEPLLE
jgi:hypothetical protein